MEEVGDVDLFLVTDQLASGFLRLLRRPLVLGDDERDPVHERDHIAAAGLDAAGALDRHLGGHVIDIVGWVLPVDVAKGVRLGVPADPLGDGRSEDEQVVDLLIRAAKALRLVGAGAEAPDGLVGILQVEVVLAASVGEVILRSWSARISSRRTLLRRFPRRARASVWESGVKPRATRSCRAGIWDWCFSVGLKVMGGLPFEIVCQSSVRPTPPICKRPDSASLCTLRTLGCCRTAIT